MVERPAASTLSRRGSVRLAIFVTHPIQYFAPLWRVLAASPEIDLLVHFFSDHSVRGALDPGFGVTVAWDVPLLDGYRHEFITRDADLRAPGSVGLPDARRRLTREHFDAVMIHGYTHRFERQVLRAAHASRLQTIIRGELTDVPPFGGRSRARAVVRDLYLRWFYRHIDTFCYVGEEARLHLRRRGIAESRMFFAPYSVDTALLEVQRSSISREAARRALGLAENQLVLLSSGKLIARKAPLLLVQAIGQIRDRERLALIVLGDGELKAQLEAEARPLLGERLHMVGFVNQSELGRHYAAADVLVHPSYFETWGLVVNEAMQFGLPAVVSTTVGCHRDLIIEGETGMVFEQGNPAALAACINRFLRASHLARDLGANARRHIASYSTDASAAGIRSALGLDARQPSPVAPLPL